IAGPPRSSPSRCRCSAGATAGARVAAAGATAAAPARRPVPARAAVEAARAGARAARRPISRTSTTTSRSEALRGRPARASAVRAVRGMAVRRAPYALEVHFDILGPVAHGLDSVLHLLGRRVELVRPAIDLAFLVHVDAPGLRALRAGSGHGALLG